MANGWWRAPVALAVAGMLGGCGGGLDDVLGGVLGGPEPTSDNVGQLVGEVQGVDTRDRLIEVRTRDGQRGQIEYDGNTTVVYRQEQYPVTALERGDIVEMYVQEVARGRYYTDRIVVQQSVQEREGTVGGERIVQESGTVREIEYRRGWFDLDNGRRIVTVTLPYNPPSDVVRDFERLRQGSRVTVEGYLVGDDRIELIRFGS